MIPNQDSAFSNQKRVSAFLGSPFDWLLLIGLLSTAPLMLVQIGNLWSRKHLQFFPIAWLLFVLVIIYRAQLTSYFSGLRSVLGKGLLVLSVFVVAISVVAFSPWFTQVGALLLISGWMLVRCQSTIWTVFGWSTLLAVTIPLPMNLDEKVIQQLQVISSNSASRILDLTATKHLLRGNVIELRQGNLFVDQACSGVDSLYALTSVCLALLIWQRRSGLVAGMTLLTVPLWAWFGNVIRLLVVTISYDRFEIDLVHGWQHSLLGLLTFSIAFAGLLATVRFLSVLLEPAKGGNSWCHKLYNHLVRWPKDTLAVVSIAESNHATNSWKVYHCFAGGMFALAGFASVGPVFSIGPWRQKVVSIPAFDSGQIASVFSASSLPANIQQMVQTDFRIEHRERDDILGEYSATWFYQSKHSPIIISLDFPFPSFHALEVCYELTGSQVLDGMKDTAYDLETEPKYIREGEITDQFGETSYIYYMEFTASGTFDKATRTVWEKLVPRQLLESLFQLQLVVKNSIGLTEKQHVENRQLLMDTQKLLLPLIREMR